MALPSNGTRWPLEACKATAAQYAEADAWYVGSSTRLQAQYGHGAFAGRGLIGSLKALFWGKPENPNEPVYKLHVPVASDLAVASADLLFSEPLSLSFPDDTSDAVKARLDTLLTKARWDSKLLEAAEQCAALGDIYLRVTWDEQGAGRRAIPTVVDPDRVTPTFRWGDLVEALIETVIAGPKDTKFVHFERHVPGRVEHALYQVIGDKLTIVPLGTLPETAGLTVDEGGGIETGHDGLAIVHVKNIGPNRALKNDAVGKHLGRADTQGLEPLMDSLDKTYTSLIRELDIGQGRIIVPQNMLKTDGPGKGASFDFDQSVFVGLKSPDTGDGGLAHTLTAQQFAIRVDEHLAMARALLEQILRGAGYGPQTFGLHDGAAGTTATEVHARDRRTNATREKKSRNWEAALEAFLTALIAIDAAKFPEAGARAVEVGVEFPNDHAPSLAELAQSVALLNQAEAASTETKVRMLHAEWDDKQIGAEVALVRSENGMSVTDIGLLPE